MAVEWSTSVGYNFGEWKLRNGTFGYPLTPAAPTHLPSPFAPSEAEVVCDGAVILSIFDWNYHSRGHSDFQIAEAISQHFPVLFANSIGMRMPQPGNSTAPYKRMARKLASIVRPAERAPIRNVTFVSPISLPIYDGMGYRLNASVVGMQLERWKQKLGINAPLVIITCPTYALVSQLLKPSRLVYNRSDDHAAYPGVNRPRIIKLEQQLFRNVDSVVYSSRSLFDKEQSIVGSRAVFSGHGVDLEAFTCTGHRAAEIEALPQPRVGFFGNLREQALDFELIAGLARRLPGVTFILGGPCLDELRAVRGIKNVHLLPACAHEDMPSRWRALDIAFLPYKLNSWVEAIQPIKLNEIMAVGLPVVATPIPAVRRSMYPMKIAANLQDFAAAIEDLCSDPERLSPMSRQQRRARIAINSWGEISNVFLGRQRKLA